MKSVQNKPDGMIKHASEFLSSLILIHQLSNKNYNVMKNVLLLFGFILLVFFSAPLNAQLSVDAGGTTYTVDFDNTVSGVNNGQFNGTGFTPAPAAGQLDSDAWASTGMSDNMNATFGGSYTTGDFARGATSGGITSGGFYAFQAATANYSFGAQPTSADWTPGTITLKILNNTGSPVISFDISYIIQVLNDQDRANSFNFSYSTDNATYTPVVSLNYTSPEAKDATPAWTSVPRNTTISPINIPSGSYFYIRWESDDISGSGSRDELAVDDIDVTAATGTVSPPVKLAVTSINGGTPPNNYDPFSVTVEAQDNSSIPQNVTTNVNVALSLATGTGTLGGTLAGTILSGTSSVIISGVTYTVAETGVSITATDLSAGLNPGTSDPFEVVEGPTVVPNIASLRAGILENEYILSNEAVLTFQQSFRNQKYIQDATAAILIDDDNGVITTIYAVGNGITGIRGTLTEFENMLQFVPSEDPGTATSSGNTITPQVITLSQLYSGFNNYESELVKIADVTFANAGAAFANGTVYPITDASKAAGNFRTTFYNVDYIGTNIPALADITGIPNSRAEGHLPISK
jgi:hypothetical protein